MLDDRILSELLSAALDDDELATLLGVRRQVVNQACRRLAESGRLTRTSAVGSKIVNHLPLGVQKATERIAQREPDALTLENAGVIQSGLGFEVHARTELTAAWGIDLRSRVVALRGGVRHSFGGLRSNGAKTAEITPTNLSYR
jgi:DNA-binding GntR family transcriptional regulator